MPDSAPQQKSFMVKVGEYTALAFVIPTTTFVGLAIGWWIDGKFGTHIWYIVFLLLGIAGGLIEVIRYVQKDQKDKG